MNLHTKEEMLTIVSRWFLRCCCSLSCSYIDPSTPFNKLQNTPKHLHVLHPQDRVKCESFFYLNQIETVNYTVKNIFVKMSELCWSNWSSYKNSPPQAFSWDATEMKPLVLLLNSCARVGYLVENGKRYLQQTEPRLVQRLPWME